MVSAGNCRLVGIWLLQFQFDHKDRTPEGPQFSPNDH